MMERISKQWSRVEEDVERGPAVGDDAPLQGVLEQIGDVRDLLKRMCRASVQRTTLKEAVREALFPILAEHRDELFPELVELRRRLADSDPEAIEVYRVTDGESAAVITPDELAALRESQEASAGVRRRLEQFESRLDQLGELFRSSVDGLRSDFDALSEVDQRTQSQVQDVGGRIEEVDGQIRDFDGQIRGFDGQIRGFDGQIRDFEGRMGEVRSSLERLENALPETARAAAGEVETKLRKEIEDMVAELTERLAELRETLGRLEANAPPRALIEGLDQRLERLESTFERVAGDVGETRPEVRALADRFENLRHEIGAVSSDLRRTGDGVGAVRSLIAARLDELQNELRGGISRWESDQSAMQERLTGLRDSLRDQLLGFQRQFEGAEGSLWGKIRGKKDARLKLNAEEFDALSQKLEGIIGGLEKVIARRTT